MYPVYRWCPYRGARNTMEPLNNGHGGDEHFVHCSEVVPSLEVEMYGQLMAGGQAVCPL